MTDNKYQSILKTPTYKSKEPLEKVDIKNKIIKKLKNNDVHKKVSDESKVHEYMFKPVGKAVESIKAHLKEHDSKYGIGLGAISALTGGYAAKKVHDLSKNSNKTK